MSSQPFCRGSAADFRVSRRSGYENEKSDKMFHRFSPSAFWGRSPLYFSWFGGYFRPAARRGCERTPSTTQQFHL